MFGDKTGPEDSYAIIDRAIDAGINFLDTANVYSRGRSEEVTGEALKRNGKRDRIVLATKVHGKMARRRPERAGNQPPSHHRAVRGEPAAVADRLY